MSLLTQEQQVIINDTRELLQIARFNDIPAVSVDVAEKLVVLIDDLQSRHSERKQYTEQELREWFENRPLVQDEIDALLHEVVPGENEAWYSVLKFAAHVGALKAEP